MLEKPKPKTSWRKRFDELFKWTDFGGNIGNFVLVKKWGSYDTEKTARNDLKQFISQELKREREEIGKALRIPKKLLDYHRKKVEEGTSAGVSLYHQNLLMAYGERNKAIDNYLKEREK